MTSPNHRRLSLSLSVGVGIDIDMPPNNSAAPSRPTVLRISLHASSEEASDPSPSDGKKEGRNEESIGHFRCDCPRTC
jgi:hypothetical protein